MEGPIQEQIPEIKDSFDEQWSHPAHVKIASGEEFDIYDIKPEEGEQKTETPLVIGLGWSEIPQSHKNHIREFVTHGRRVISADTPHGISVADETREKIKQEGEVFPEIEMKKMQALIETLKAKAIEIQVDILARSEGSIYSIMLAYLYPQLVRNLILENPSGLIGSTDVGSFAMHWLKDMKQNIRKEYTYQEAHTYPPAPNTNVDMNAIIKRDPLGSMSSVLAISTMDVREMLKDIKANGIGIAVIATTDDELFPIQKMAGSFEPNPLSITGEGRDIPELTAEHVDGFLSLRGKHASYLDHPEKFSMAIDQTLDALEAKEKNLSFSPPSARL